MDQRRSGGGVQTGSSDETEPGDMAKRHQGHQMTAAQAGVTLARYYWLDLEKKESQEE